VSRDGDDEAKLDTDQKIRRSVARTFFNGLLLLLCLALLGGWAYTGLYMIDPGEAAVVLRLGRYERTIFEPGLRWHLPPPLEYVEKVDVARIRRQEFGLDRTETDVGGEGAGGSVRESAIQTADSNIVNVAYELQYKVGDPYAYRFSMADPGAVLHDATEAAMRSVIGKRTIDAVLSQDRSEIESEARELLGEMLSSYVTDVGHESAFAVGRINLEKPQAPEAVREAFADVVSAGQDEKRSSLEASGDAQEILQRARSEAAELREQAEAYKRAKIIEARGEATRFEALVAEYQLAPEVTRRRLYLETMEEILPGIEKMVVEPNTVNMLPMLPLGRQPSGLGAAQ